MMSGRTRTLARVTDGAPTASPPGPTADLDDEARRARFGPREAPTTRGFAGVLLEGLDGLPAAEVLAVPDDVPDRLGLTRAITPLRMRGMSAMLGRIKRKIREAQ